MTSLIDVIFLLLLFFMLSSTFTKFAEVELAAGGAGGAADSATRPAFLQLAPTEIRLNGADNSLDQLPEALKALFDGQDKRRLLVQLQGEVTAQRLTDLLVTLRKVPGLAVTVLEAA